MRIFVDPTIWGQPQYTEACPGSHTETVRSRFKCTSRGEVCKHTVSCRSADIAASKIDASDRLKHATPSSKVRLHMCVCVWTHTSEVRLARERGACIVQTHA
eukprot:6199066-Pleurochrysis_carterae.AAC.5